MAILDHSLPLQVKAPDMMGMLDQGSQLAQFYTQNKADGELNRLYKETNGDLNKMLEIGKTSPMARFVIPQLQAQQAAQQKAALDKQKTESEIYKNMGSGGKDYADAGETNQKIAAARLLQAKQAVFAGAENGNPEIIRMGLNEAKAAGAINEQTYTQFIQQLDSLGKDPVKISEWAKGTILAGSQNPASFVFQTKDNAADNAQSDKNSQRTYQASIYGTDKDYQLGQQELDLKQKLEQQKINIEQNQGEIVSGSDGMGYIFYKNRPAGNRYEPLLGQDGTHVKAPMTSTNKGGMSATAQKELFEVNDSISSATNGIANLRDALKYSAKAYDGVGASQRAAVVGNFKDSEEATATAMLNNIVTGNALEMLKATFGGAPTEGERAILLQLQGSANLPRAQREAIYNRAIQMAERRLQANQAKAEGIRNGGFFKSSTQQIPAPITKPSDGGKPNAIDFFK